MSAVIHDDWRARRCGHNFPIKECTATLCFARDNQQRLESYDYLAGSLIGICQSLLTRLEEPSGCCTNSNTAYVREIREVLNELFTLKAKGEEARRK